MDTVYDVEQPFQTCRTLPNGHVNGPGVADAKGGIVVMLEALRAFEQSPFADQLGWDVLINPDEEIGSPGSWPIIRELADQSDFGLLFEPGLDERHIASWRKGSGNFSFVVRGRAAHAGRHFDEGKNAIIHACKLAGEIDQLNVDPEVTFNIGKISGGEALNQVPDLAIVRLNVRVRTEEQQTQVESQLQAIVERFNSVKGYSVKQHGLFSSPPKPMTEALEGLLKRVGASAQALEIPLAWKGTGGACDGNKFAAAGLPNVDSLGPLGGRIHSDEEFLIPESLVPRAKLAAHILMSFASE